MPDPTGTVFLPVHGKIESKKLSNVRAVPCRKLEGCQTSSIRNSLKCDAESGIIGRFQKPFREGSAWQGFDGKYISRYYAGKCCIGDSLKNLLFCPPWNSFSVVKKMDVLYYFLQKSGCIF